MDANKMREKANAAACDNILELIDDCAGKGYREVDISNYDTLYLTDECEEMLKKKGFEIDGNTIRW